MRPRHWPAAIALLAAAVTAHAEHFQYRVDLSGTYSEGGTDGCYPPDFNQPACPQPGKLTATLSFDTPDNSDGSYSIEGNFGDITDFSVNLGEMPEDSLFGGVNVVNGAPNGSVQAADQSETFTFDWASRSATYVYDYGYHNPNGSFAGTLSAVPEPAPTPLMLTALAGMVGVALRRGARRDRT